MATVAPRTPSAANELESSPMPAATPRKAVARDRGNGDRDPDRGAGASLESEHPGDPGGERDEDRLRVHMGLGDDALGLQAEPAGQPAEQVQHAGDRKP